MNLQQAEADFKRYRDLKDQGFISGAELERRETTLKVAQAQLAQARAQSGVQGNQAGYSALTADAGGVITGVDVEPGMVVAAGAPVLRLAHDGPRDVVFAVPEDKVALVQAIAARRGPVQVRLWSSERDDACRRRSARSPPPPIRRPAPSWSRPISAARRPRRGSARPPPSRSPTPRLAGIARVPLSALKEHQGGSSVWIVDPASMTAVARPVRIGGAEGSEAIVLAGLSPGDRVVTAGVHVLQRRAEGAPLRRPRGAARQRLGAGAAGPRRGRGANLPATVAPAVAAGSAPLR